MKTSRRLLSSAAILTMAVLVLCGTLSERTTLAQTSVPADKAMIDQLVLINRMLASKELAILVAYGHVSVRSPRNSNHYFLSRAVSPGVVTASDVYESDLENKPVAGNQSDLLPERFIHGEIYKARPDVMAIVYSSVPELVTFSVSSVPLRLGNAPVPVFDIRRVDGGVNGVINTPALGHALAQSLGRSNAALILGGGAVIVSSSTNNAVSGAYSLQAEAQQQLFATSLGGTLNHLVFTREKDVPEAGGTNVGPGSAVVRADRFSIYFNYLGARELARTKPSNTTAAQRPPQSDQALIEELVVANRLLASPELGVLTPDGLAHVSARSRTNPNHFFIAHDVSPGMVIMADIIEDDLDSKPVKAGNVPQYSERFIHGEIYRARPEVMAILHAHTPELRIFGQSSVKLRPVLNKALFIGNGLPIFDITKFTGGAPSPVSCVACISTPELGRALVGVIGNRDAALLLDHGITVVDSSVPGLVSRAYNLRMNARIQQTAISLGGTVNYLEASGAESIHENRTYPEWDYWKEMVLSSVGLNSVPKPVSGLPARPHQ